MVARLALALIVLLLLSACGGTPPAPRSSLAGAEQERTIFIVPFSTAMVPPEVEEMLFDRFVDDLNDQGKTRGFQFVILKGGAEPVDPQWLRQQLYVTGDILGYVEDSGCCSTSIRLRGRARLFHPGNDRPTATLEVPRETFFEHDYATKDAERQKLAENVATALARKLLASLSSP